MLATLPLQRADLYGLAAEEVERLWGDVAVLHAELGELAQARAHVDAMAREPWVFPRAVQDLRATLDAITLDALTYGEASEAPAGAGWAKGVLGLAH